MEGRDLDSYLTKFHTLAAKAGYGLNEEGTLNLMRRGLPAELGKEIIRRENPQMWNEWERAAHNEHDVWLKLKSLYPSFTPKKEKFHFGRTEGEWHCTFKGKGHYTHPNNRMVPMDTSVDCINRTMTDDEKTRMIREGRCFQCGNKGHMSKGCPTCSSNPPSYSPNASTSNTGYVQHARKVKVEEEEEEEEEPKETKMGVNQVINSINAMNDDEKEDLLMKAFAQKKDF
jgi:predicted  nucleic acid-binding Zn-ribbon protein